VQAAKERTTELFPLAAIAASGTSGDRVKNSHPGFAASETERHPALPVRSLQNALGFFAELRRNRIGVICYGDEITSTSNDRLKFATYTRDSYTGLDYADQRHFASSYGRFMTPDPLNGSGRPVSPLTWNRYSYVGGDPINRKDPSGLDPCNPGDDDYDPSDPSCGDWGVSGGGFVSSGGSYNPALDPNYIASIWLEGTLLELTDYRGNQVVVPSGTTLTPLCPLVAPVGSYSTASSSVNALFAPEMAGDLTAAFYVLNQEGIVPQINSGFRTVAQQASIPPNNGYPVAPPGQSWHNVGLAVDIQLTLPRRPVRKL
jgi:RHS repeat-associated protein